MFLPVSSFLHHFLCSNNNALDKRTLATAGERWDLGAGGLWATRYIPPLCQDTNLSLSASLVKGIGCLFPSVYKVLRGLLTQRPFLKHEIKAGWNNRKKTFIMQEYKNPPHSCQHLLMHVAFKCTCQRCSLFPPLFRNVLQNPSNSSVSSCCLNIWFVKSLPSQP